MLAGIPEPATEPVLAGISGPATELVLAGIPEPVPERALAGIPAEPATEPVLAGTPVEPATEHVLAGIPEPATAPVLAGIPEPAFEVCTDGAALARTEFCIGEAAELSSDRACAGILEPLAIGVLSMFSSSKVCRPSRELLIEPTCGKACKVCNISIPGALTRVGTCKAFGTFPLAACRVPVLGSGICKACEAGAALGNCKLAGALLAGVCKVAVAVGGGTTSRFSGKPFDPFCLLPGGGCMMHRPCLQVGQLLQQKHRTTPGTHHTPRKMPWTLLRCQAWSTAWALASEQG